jgi:hypothetical protein
MRALLFSGFLLGLASCSTSSFQAEPPVLRSPSSEVPPADTISLASRLQPYVKKLNEPIFTYHYVTRELMGVATTGILNTDDPKLSTHVQDWSNYFFDLSQPGGTGMIRGLYLATDPVVSRDFGKDHWLLYRVVLKAGMTYLDMKTLEAASETIPADVQEQLKSKGCAEEKWSSLMYKSFDPACRAIAVKTLQDLDVALVDYAWMSADFPPCTQRPNDAFILLKPDRLASDAVLVLYAEMPHDDITVMKRQLIMEKLFSEAKPSAGQSNSTSPENNPDKYRLWPDMNAASVTEADFELYLRGHIYGCESIFSKMSVQ